MYTNADIVRINNKFPCLLCPDIYRLRQTTRQHMISVHKAEFGETPRTLSRYRNKARLEVLRLKKAGFANTPHRPTSNTKPGQPLKRRRLNQIEDLNESIQYINNNSDSDNRDTQEDGNTDSQDNIALDIPEQNNQTESNNLLDNNELVFNVTDSSLPDGFTGEFLRLPLYMSHGQKLIQRGDHLISVMSFSERYKLPAAATASLIELITLHLPENVSLETRFCELQKLLGFKPSELQKHWYCKKCRLPWNLETGQCSNNTCMHGKSDYFMSSSLVQQLRLILARNGYWQSIKNLKKSQRDNLIEDVYDGETYKKLLQDGKFLHGAENNNITFTVFTDGVLLYKSTNVTIWGIYVVINELPLKVRYNINNMAVWGVFQDTHKPDSTYFYGKFAEHATQLYTEGFTLNVNNADIRIKCLALIFTQDLEARAFMFQMKRAGAAHACSICLVKGDRIPYGKGKSRHYDPQEPNVIKRTLQSCKDAARVGNSENPEEGFIGYSPLLDLPLFELTNIAIDTMHCIPQGVLKKLLIHWFQIRKCVAFIGEHLITASGRMCMIKPTKQISRLPTGMNFSDWKASQGRAFILYYGLFVLEDLLPELQYRHFALLVEATYIILKTKITHNDLQRAEYCFNQFVLLFENVYMINGKPSPVTLNIHNLTHMVQCVRELGPGFIWSVYTFEGFHLYLLRGCHGSTSVKQQFFWNSLCAKVCANRLETATGHVAEYLQSVGHNSKFKTTIETLNCAVIGLLNNCTHEYRNILADHFGDANVKHFKLCSKIIQNGTYYDSRACSRIKKRNTHVVHLNNSIDGADILDVAVYILDLAMNTVFAWGTMYKRGDCMVGNIAPHIRRLLIDGMDEEFRTFDPMFGRMRIMVPEHKVGDFIHDLMEQNGMIIGQHMVPEEDDCNIWVPLNNMKEVLDVQKVIQDNNYESLFEHFGKSLIVDSPHLMSRNDLLLELKEKAIKRNLHIVHLFPRDRYSLEIDNYESLWYLCNFLVKRGIEATIYASDLDHVARRISMQKFN